MLMALTLCQGTELTSSPNIPPRLLNHSSDACGCTDNSHGPDGNLLLASANLPLFTCCGPKITQEPDQKPAFHPCFLFLPLPHPSSKNCQVCLLNIS